VISTSQMPLPTQHQRKTRISMPLAEFEPVIPAILCLRRHRHRSCTALADSKCGLCRLSFKIQYLNLYRIFMYIEKYNLSCSYSSKKNRWIWINNWEKWWRQRITNKQTNITVIFMERRFTKYCLWIFFAKCLM